MYRVWVMQACGIHPLRPKCQNHLFLGVGGRERSLQAGFIFMFIYSYFPLMPIIYLQRWKKLPQDQSRLTLKVQFTSAAQRRQTLGVVAQQISCSSITQWSSLCEFVQSTVEQNVNVQNYRFSTSWFSVNNYLGGNCKLHPQPPISAGEVAPLLNHLF